MDVGDLVMDLPENDPGASIVACVNARESAQVIPAPAPLQAAEIHAIGHPEVVERAEQVGAERVPEPQLGGDPSAEEGTDVRAVRALWCGCQPEELSRGQVVRDAAVGRRLGVVELVDDHHVVGVRRDVGDVIRGEGLDGGEDVAPPLGAGAADIQLTEARV